MQKTPRGLRIQIGIFGRRNAGKSSFLNTVTRQQVSIVSDVAGTTTDPVEKAMELLPLGPVLFIDTAGIDDVGALGALRVEKSRKIIERADVAAIVCDAGQWGEFEEGLVAEFTALETPVVVVFNKDDLASPSPALEADLTTRDIAHMRAVACEGRGATEFRQLLMQVVPEALITPPTILGDMVRGGDTVVLVVPIDLEAPKGRLIMPQVQTIRDLLDHDATCVVVKERELRNCLDNMKTPPALVVTDSQAFLKVAGDTPADVPMTSFSVLFARFKGDLPTFVEGARQIEHLAPGDKVLIAEGCTHHPIGEDIGRVKIPRWLTMHVGGKLDFTFFQGHDFPPDIDQYKLVIHCGSCTFNRREVLTRVMRCREAGVPITNYGVAIAYTLGIFERALAPFPALSQTTALPQ